MDGVIEILLIDMIMKSKKFLDNLKRLSIRDN